VPVLVGFSISLEGGSMKFPKVLLCALALVVMLCSFGVVMAQEAEPTPAPKTDVVQKVSENKFRRVLLKAAQQAAAKKEISRADVVRLRVASLSPAFLAQAEKLAVVQMAFSGDEVPTDDEGKIETGKIDWDALLAFIEKLIPLILQLIDLFALNDRAGNWTDGAVHDTGSWTVGTVHYTVHYIAAA
jgi:hypothetical protein